MLRRRVYPVTLSLELSGCTYRLRVYSTCLDVGFGWLLVFYFEYIAAILMDGDRQPSQLPRRLPSPSRPGINLTTSRLDSKRPGNEQKTRAIDDACDLQDYQALVSLATSSGGLLHDTLRQKACELASRRPR
jgi:hypothetical protein